MAKTVQKSDSRQYLLDEEKYYEADSSLDRRNLREAYGVLLCVYFVLIHILFITLVALCFFFPYTLNLQSPGYRHIAPDLRRLDQARTSRSSSAHNSLGIYAGPPSKNNNDAWDDLIRPLYFNISVEEVASIELSARLPDSVKVLDGGYLAALEVYHQLHCLRQLRMWIYQKEFYYSTPAAEKRYVREHLDHCIEGLRKTLTCSPSFQVNLFTWRETTSASFDAPSKPFAPISQPRTCVNWAGVEAWAKMRQISLTPTVLKPIEEEGEMES